MAKRQGTLKLDILVVLNCLCNGKIGSSNGRTILKKSGRQGFRMCTGKLIYVQICLPIITPVNR